MRIIEGILQVVGVLNTSEELSSTDGKAGARMNAARLSAKIRANVVRISVAEVAKTFGGARLP